MAEDGVMSSALPGSGPPYNEGAECGACGGPTNGYRCGCPQSEAMRLQLWPDGMSAESRLATIAAIARDYTQLLKPQFVPRELFVILEIASSEPKPAGTGPEAPK